MKNKTSLTPILIIVTIAALFLTACQTLVTPGSGTYTPGTYKEAETFSPDKELTATNFKTVDEFNDFVKTSGQASNSYYGAISSSMMRGGEMMVKMDATEAAAAPQADVALADGGSGSSDYSETNVQVPGVDEADIIKTDGDYIYTITDNTLFIIQAYPGEDAKIVSTIDFNNTPTSLFINGDYLAIFGNFNNIDFFREIDFRPSQGMTYFDIYDISDKENPELVKDYKFEGNYFDSRMNGDYVYFVTTTQPQYRDVYPTPIMMEGSVIKEMPVSSIYRFGIPYSYAQLATISAIKITDPEQDVNSKTVVVEYGQNMYMSDENIYITYTEYINEWEITNEITISLMEDKLTDADKALVAKIKETDNDVLSQAEKESKILQIIYTYTNYMTSEEQQDFQDLLEEKVQAKLDEYEYREFTVIHRVSVDQGEISIDANGKVPGHIMNQFSMDEYDGVFRIATTIGEVWTWKYNNRTESTNNVFTLNSDLEVMDSLKGLAKGEQIYSTRFMGDRLYMVTFEQVDPFFVIDLSDPDNIEELGKLKIPGFSRYLHPYDENTIIGIGRDTSTTGRVQGLKISLFDVTDVEHPEEVAKFVTDERYAQSTAEYEHKAFLFSKEKNLLVIPAYSYDYGYDGQNSEGYNGAMVFKITKDDIELHGIIDHSKGQSEYYTSLVERSLYINELLYTKSRNLLRINKIDDLSSVKSIELTGTQQGPYPIY